MDAIRSPDPFHCVIPSKVSPDPIIISTRSPVEGVGQIINMLYMVLASLHMDMVPRQPHYSTAGPADEDASFSIHLFSFGKLCIAFP